MTTAETLAELQSRILARYSLIFLTTWEEERWESELATLSLDLRRGLVAWSVTQGFQPPLTDAAGPEIDPLQVLNQINSYPPDHVFLLKDFHPFLSQPAVVRKLRDLVGELAESNRTLLLMGPTAEIPLELERDAVVVDLPFPDIDDLRPILDETFAHLEKTSGKKIVVPEEIRDRMLKSVAGLTLREAGKALNRALLGREKIDDDLFVALVAEKRTLLRGSDLLEFHDLEESLKDIGGLEGLKDWLKSRSMAYSEKARKAGLPLPRGALLLGVQGCGKSLTARAAARLLGFPLVRLDISMLMSSDRGSSEKNMREVLQSIEAISPAVLWLDEVEKSFGGVEGGQDGTLTRLFGTFLTWLQDHRKPVFVVATANSVTNLPPEMLRRGRFDELFFINLPNYHERKHILEIHLRKRRINPAAFNLEELAQRTEGYSGAELEQVVKSAMFDAYTASQKLSQEALLEAQEQTVPLSVTMEEKIFELREWARTRCRAATPDSRVMQMLEEEGRDE